MPIDRGIFHGFIYTVPKHAQAISAIVGQTDTVITFDQASYTKAKQLQWRLSDEKVIIRVGGFHIAPNYLALMGEKYASSGVDDLLVESGVYGAGGVSALMKGKAYKHSSAYCGRHSCQSSGQDVVSFQRGELSQKIKSASLQRPRKKELAPASDS